MSVSFISMSCFFVAWSFCMRLWMFFHKSRCTIIALFLGIFFQEFFIFWTSLGHNKRHINHSKLWGNCMLYFESISCCWAFHFLVEREVSFIIPFLKYFIAVCLFHILRFFDTLICFHSKIISIFFLVLWCFSSQRIWLNSCQVLCSLKPFFSLYCLSKSITYELYLALVREDILSLWEL